MKHRWLTCPALLLTVAAQADEPEPNRAFWDHDWVVAGDAFTAYLNRFPNDADAWRKRGITWLERHDEARARADFEEACRLEATNASCDYLEAMAGEHARFELSVDPTFISGAVDEARTRLAMAARVKDGVRLGVAGELRVRDGARDVLGYLSADWHTGDFAVEATIGAGFSPTFAPDLEGSMSAAVHVTTALWGSLRYQRVDFGADGAHILSPAVTLALGALELEGRYWLGMGDDAALDHAALVRARYTFHTLTFEAGAGIGADSDRLAGAEDDHGFIALGGLRWSPVWQVRLALSYAWRASRQELAMSWQLTF